ncbi:MAG: GNAT family N-acetyltransferase [Clostridia bacterium]|nr:GNAT family N-acetyltransferase [Clostridia bacterium]
MNGVELYLKFRQELDKICVPVILENLKCVEYIEHDGKTVGMVGGVLGYIDIVYVLPEYRRKGLAKKAVLEWYNKYQAPYENTRLHIINNNIPALNFWKSIFELWEVGHNEFDTLYEILRVKGDEE